MLKVQGVSFPLNFQRSVATYEVSWAQGAVLKDFRVDEHRADEIYQRGFPVPLFVGLRLPFVFFCFIIA